MAFAVFAALIVWLFVSLASTAAGNAGDLSAANNTYNKDADGLYIGITSSLSNSTVPKKLAATSNEPIAVERAGATSKMDVTGDGATSGADAARNQVASQAVEKPTSYVWTCARDYGGIAPEDGSLSEWAPHYYIAHSYGPYGEAILQLEPGDIVTVNGNEVTVQGSVELNKSCSYQEVMDTVGWEVTVFQTCIPNSDQNRFVYARGACSTEQAAQEARRWGGLDGEVLESASEQEMPMRPQTIVGSWAQLEPQVGSEPPENRRPERPESSGHGFVFGQRGDAPGEAFGK